MATANPKIVLSRSQDIPFNKLVLSQANVRRVKAGISVEDLAEDIARRTLLQGLSVRPVLDADGAETGTFEVPAGGRRFRALELLVKQKRMTKTQPVPCVVRTDGLAEEDSLAENVQRVALHPLDQFRAFQTLRESGLSEEEIAARFFVNPSVVKQRLKLAAVSPKLLDLYAEDEMRSSSTWLHGHRRPCAPGAGGGGLSVHNKDPTSAPAHEGACALHKRARFVGVKRMRRPVASSCAPFQQDDGGWLQIRRCSTMVVEKLERSQYPGEAGNGSRSRRNFPTAIPPGCAA
jgi:ParB family chromosome partitioning protein